jgi:hypothetical protein
VSEWSYFVAYVHSSGHGSATWACPAPITSVEQVAEMRAWLDQAVAADAPAWSERSGGPVVITSWQLLSAPDGCCPSCGTGTGVELV